MGTYTISCSYDLALSNTHVFWTLWIAWNCKYCCFDGWSRSYAITLSFFLYLGICPINFLYCFNKAMVEMCKLGHCENYRQIEFAKSKQRMLRRVRQRMYSCKVRPGSLYTGSNKNNIRQFVRSFPRMTKQTAISEDERPCRSLGSIWKPHEERWDQTHPSSFPRCAWWVHERVRPPYDCW